MYKWLIKRTSTDAGGGSPNNASQIKRIKHVVLDSSVRFYNDNYCYE